MFIDDCIKGIQDIMYSEINEPINLGSSEMVSINGLVDIVEDIAGYKLVREYDLNAPKGVRGRNSENTLIRKYLGWEPSIPLREGMKKTFDWINLQLVDENKSRKGINRFNKYGFINHGVSLSWHRVALSNHVNRSSVTPCKLRVTPWLG